MSAPISTIVTLAVRNVRRNWRRSLASSLAIIAGFAAISLFDGFLKDLGFVISDGYASRGMLGHVLIQRKDAQHKLVEDTWAYAMTMAEQDLVDQVIASENSVVSRVRFLDVKGMISNGRNNAVFVGFAHDVKEGTIIRTERWQWNTLAGKPLHLAASENVVGLGMGLGQMMECTSDIDVRTVTRRGGGYVAADRPFQCERPRMQLTASTEAAQVNSLDLAVTGLVDAGFREADKHWVTLPLTTAQKLLDTDKVTMISVLLKHERDVPQFIETMKKKSKAAGYELDVMRWQDHNLGSFMRSTQGILGTFKGIFMSIVIAIVVLSVANTMMKSVNERIREIGALRSMGFYKTDIRRIFTLEGMTLALSGSVIGLAATVLIALIINFSGIRYKAGMLSVPVFLTIGMNPWIWISNTLWLTTLASFTAWFSSNRAAKLVVADALRH